MNNKLTLLACGIGTLWACDPEPPLPDGHGAVQLAATSSDPHDVAQFEFLVIEDGSGDCVTGTVVDSQVVPLNTLVLANHLFVLPADGYLVCALPQQQDGSPSAECATASSNVTVVSGQTTSVGLASACTGGGNGAIDVTATLEEYPLIQDLAISTGRYFEICSTPTLTATLDDPGSDGFNSIQWTVQTAPTGATTSFGSPTQATTSFSADALGEYELTLTVDDQLGGVQSLTFPMTGMPCASAGDPQWLVGTTAGGSDDDRIFDVAPRGTGFATVGMFRGDIDLGDGQLSTMPSIYNAFVAAYAADGSVLWSRRYGGSGANATAVAVDAAGDIFVSGSTGAATGGGITDLGGACPTFASGQDEYVAKLDGATGACLWAFATTNQDYAEFELAIDSAGNLIAVTEVNWNLQLSDGTFVPGTGTQGIAILRRDGATGSGLGVETIQAPTGFFLVRGISLGPADEVVVAGRKTNTLGAGTETLALPGTTLPLVYDGTDSEGFVVAVDMVAGQTLWANTAPGTGWSDPIAIASNANGNHAVMWGIEQDADFGGGLVSPNGHAVVRYGPAGAFLDAALLPDTSSLSVRDMVSAGADELRIAGLAYGPFDVGTGIITPTNTEAVVWSFTPSTANTTWLTRAESAGEARIDLAADGGTFVAGYAGAAVSLGPLSLPFNGGVSDLYLAKLAP